jgi:HlyD family secretion protein
MSRWRWAAGAGLLVLAAALVLGLSRSGVTPVATATAARADLSVPILCDGTLEPPPGGELRAPESSTVARILVREGAAVKKGDELVLLVQPELREKALEARASILRLEAERSALAADLEHFRREANRAKAIVESDRRLLEEGAITKDAAETDALSYSEAQERARKAEDRLAVVQGPRSQLELARASAAELESRVAALTIRSRADGIAFGLPRKEGELVQQGQVVASVANPDHRQIRARVDQPDLVRVSSGNPMRITFDGLPDRRWDGKVVQVAPGLREVAGRQVGEILGEIADPASELPPNASVNVQIVAAEKRSALVLPRSALYRDGDRRYVFQVAAGRARRRDVEVGLVGPSQVEITKGLSGGDVVVLPGAYTLRDGQRVKATS